MLVNVEVYNGVRVIEWLGRHEGKGNTRKVGHAR